MSKVAFKDALQQYITKSQQLRAKEKEIRESLETWDIDEALSSECQWTPIMRED